MLTESSSRRSTQIASLLALKADAEKQHGHKIKLVLYGAAESHLLADEIAASNVSVIVAPVRGFPNSFDKARALPGAPLTPKTTLETLFDAGVVRISQLDSAPPPG